MLISRNPRIILTAVGAGIMYTVAHVLVNRLQCIFLRRARSQFTFITVKCLITFYIYFRVESSSFSQHAGPKAFQLDVTVNTSSTYQVHYNSRYAASYLQLPRGLCSNQPSRPSFTVRSAWLHREKGSTNIHSRLGAATHASAKTDQHSRMRV